ncbi:MAG TPA: hypothetical protein VGF16_03350 [Bryobacteraceae bacterium]
MIRRSMARCIKGWFQTVVAAGLLAAVPGTTSAQWPPYQSRRPDLESPAPKAADGHPDFSGIWRFVDSPAARQGPPPPRGVGTIGIGLRAPGLNQFFDIGSTLPNGLPFQPWAADLRKRRAADNNKDNPDAHCLPLGLMQLHTHPEPRKIIQAPGVIVILYEANGGIRQIFTDGRPLPRNPQPWWYGYSTAKWDGDTLVVQTNGFRDDVWLDVEGSPLTEAAMMTERFRRPNFGNVQIEITVDDPKAYTKPWTVTVNHRLMPDTELIEFVCNENERDVPHMK